MSLPYRSGGWSAARLVALLLLAPMAAQVCLPARACAASQPSDLEKARRLLDEAEFEQALKVINDALTQPDNSDEALAELYSMQGIAYLYLGKEPRARESFEKLLQANPSYQLPKATSAKIRQIFDQVKDDVRSRRLRPVRVSHEPPESIVVSEPLELHATIVDLPQGARARVYYRRAGTESFSSTGLTKAGQGDDYTAKLPAYDVPSRPNEALEYYLEVSDAAGRRLAGSGDSLSPLSVRTRLAASTPRDGAVVDEEPVYGKWWFWTLVGVGVAGVAAAAIIIPIELNKPAEVPVTIKVQP